jgi:signal transduction histidine kinase
MFKRPWQVWLCYALALAVVLPAFAWLTYRTLELDRSGRAARSAAAHEEQVRLALWRMDSLLMPLIAQEAARPHFAYEPFALRADERVPSPILAAPSPFVLLHFQVRADGTWDSPQSPDPALWDWAIVNGTTPAGISASQERLQELRDDVEFSILWAGLPAETLPALVAAADLPPGAANANIMVQSPAQVTNELPEAPLTTSDEPAQQLVAVQQQSARDFERRNAALQQFAQQGAIQQRAGPAVAHAAGMVVESVSRPLWIGGRLLLARRVTVDGEPRIQGCWLDWDRLRTALLADIADLLPQATLAPLQDSDAVNPSRSLASLPVVLQAAASGITDTRLSPMDVALISAWAGLLLACLAIAALLHGVNSLSERRAAFVSAVTHELRTPLTTFQLYTEMLADDLVTDDAKRREYLHTLRGEADRFEHLIENVLGFARLERRPPPAQREPMRLDELLARVEPRLRARAARSAMELVVEQAGGSAARQVRADASLVEQVLLNLVDNACKYADDADDRRIILRSGVDGGRALLSVSDFGPGVPRDLQRTLFTPFSKSAERAAESRPGVGLGLALSRGLARQMGGDLSLVDGTTRGATFTLSLPLAH